ncbi:hypothetical protein [Actinoplanes lobatus]|uniref:hypothetical protein n=1 Tax=Actinoplanes lobatus TaxID=113568 RepID=UPI0019418555|nr:hypothetical protein [Actinoplanes lobatus]
MTMTRASAEMLVIRARNRPVRDVLPMVAPEALDHSFRPAVYQVTRRRGDDVRKNGQPEDDQYQQEEDAKR